MFQLKTKILLVIFVSGCLLVLPGLSVSTIFISDSSSGTANSPLSSNNFKQSEASNSDFPQDFVPFNATIHRGPITIDGDSQVATYASSGNGSATNPYIIENFNISQYTSLSLLTITGTTKYIIIQNNYLDSQYQLFATGINATNDENLIINNNKIVNDYNGILIIDAYSNGNEISIEMSNNSIMESNYAINIFNSNSIHIDKNSIVNSFEAPIYISNGINITVKDNYCARFDSALYFYQLTWSTIQGNFLSAVNAQTVLNVGSSNHNVFVNNTLQKASLLLNLHQSNWNIFSNMSFILGISTSGVPDNATFIHSSNYNTLTNSTFDSSFHYDISIIDGISNQITENTFTSAQDFNLLISSGESNIIEENSFQALGNYGNSQAYDNGFIDLFLYNYWNGWTAPDNNSDGIVDNPYLIDGLAHSYDTKPLASVSEIGLVGSNLISTVPNHSTSTQTSINSNAISTNTSASSNNNFFSSANSPMILGVAGLSLIAGIIISFIFRKIRK